jgi:CelD/BcsL family acetyltransferase involved in cellulose biosynthesis
VKVEIVRADELGPSDRDAWAAWQRADPRLANPFLSGSFARLASQHVGARVAVVRESGSSVAFWPISLARGAIGPAVPGYSDLQGIVHDPDWAWDWRRLLAAAPAGGARFDHLVGYQAESLPAIRLAESPYVGFADGWDSYLAKLRADHKKTVKDSLRRQQKAANELQGEFVDADDADEAMAVLMRQKSAQCRQNGWVDVFGSEPVRRLIGAAARSTEPDLTGRVSTLRFNGAVVAVRLIVESFGIRCGWISSYDPEFSWYRPGWNLTLLALEAAATAGCATFSLGKGTESYKSMFATGSDLVGAGSVRGPGIAGGVFAASMLPSKAVASVFARFPQAEEKVRQRVQNLRKRRYRMVPG